MNTKLLLNTLSLLIFGSALIAFCYFYVDRPVAEYCFSFQDLSKSITWLGHLVKASALIEYLPPFIALLLLIKSNVYKPLGKHQKIAMIIALNVTFTTEIKDILKLAFGRYWPTSWLGNNPSWIKGQDYGFHFFHGGASYNSFPSGHTAAIFAIMSIVWIVYPRWRWLCVLSCGGMMLSLVLLDYHFVSDTIAGMILGIITGQNMTYYFLRDPKQLPMHKQL